MKKQILFSILTLSFITTFAGCGSSSSDTATATTDGQLIDSYLQNIDYSCADGKNGITDINGSFNCTTLPVTFKLGNLTLGTLSTIPTDRQVFPQDIVGVARTDVNNSTVVAMARLLQSSDEDNNTDNGIQIKSEVISAFDANNTFNANDLDSYAALANVTLIDTTTALNHLEQSVNFIDLVNNITNLPINIKDALFTPDSNLTQSATDTISYMGNVERLAHDVYLELYNYHIDNGNGAIKQLYNIATKSETTHIETVQALINKYDLNYTSFTNIDLPELSYKDTTVDDMSMGTYDIQAVQDLHDSLIAKGEQSPQDALEVGCMVEVTDINDLTTDIQTATDSNANDVVTAFEFLRDGSYSHYWSFDKGLKNMGITDGCCSLGDAYCHPEYPQNTGSKK
jgi:hypothetical protein